MGRWCGTAIMRRSLPASACSALVGERLKDQLRQQFAVLDPVALLKTIRDAQQELTALSDGNSQPPARASEDLRAFVDGLANAWQSATRAPQGRRKKAAKDWWRTRIDPFTHTWPMVEE